MAHGTNWDSGNFDQKPVASDLLGSVWQFIRDTRQAVRQRFQSEHSFDLAYQDGQGCHKQGSARAWVSDTDPTAPQPAYGTNETDQVTGRLRVGATTSAMHVHRAGAWSALTSESATGGKIPTRNAAGEVLSATPTGSSPATASATKSYVDAESADIRADLAALIAAAKNAMIPVGFLYTQYPGQAAPATLYAGESWTWAIVSNLYAGAFFRAEGTPAATFITDPALVAAGKQAESLKPHTHSIAAPTLQMARNLGEASEGNVRSGDASAGLFEAPLPVVGSWATGSTGDTETRPVNYSIRIWKRTA